MKHVLMSLIAAVCLTGLYVAAEECAAPPVKTEVKVADVVMVTGTVVVEKNAEGVVAAVKIQPVEGAAVAIALDAAGQKVAAMADKKVVLKGTMKDGALCVTACKPVVVVETVEEAE